MRKQTGLRRVIGAAVVAAVAASALAIGTGGAGATAKVRGFDGTTIKLGSMGIAAQFGNIPVGVQARIKQFNDDNEIKGVKLAYTDFADDKGDPTTALSEARRLVTQEGVFAIVGDVSQSNPGDYFKQQQVPYFGWAFDSTYCSHDASTQIWGFGYNGCLVPSDPAWMPDAGRPSFPYVQQQSGKKNPTLTVFSSDAQAGKNSVKYQSIAYAGIGYKVVAKLNSIPFDSASIGDYSPYVTELMKSDNGNPPDSMICLMSTVCINVYQGLKAAGYKGVFISSLYSNILVKALDGSAANITYVNFADDTKGTQQIKNAVDAYQAGASAKLDSAMFVGYASTDMFIQALKTVAKKGKSNITPANVQKAAAVQTWKIPELAGPTQYPEATVGAYQSCNSEVVSDGTAWKTVTPFACSKKQYPVK
ncbi:MAG: ABC transporter substrate-binding protein [Acidimicrobiia bacterium]